MTRAPNAMFRRSRPADHVALALWSDEHDYANCRVPDQECVYVSIAVKEFNSLRRTAKQMLRA